MNNQPAEAPAWLQFIPLIVVSLLLVYPSARILKRAGISRSYALFMLFPPFYFIAIWIFAFAPWPALKDRVGRTFE